MGAWIEIKAFTGDFKTFFVAPLVGAWIEISLLNVNCAYLSSLLSWERGLKSSTVKSLFLWNTSLLSWERGLKYKEALIFQPKCSSLLSWERGLKYKEALIFQPKCSSLLSWERGLKLTLISGKEYRRTGRSSRGSVD